jgi:hypothetical protein
MSEGWSGRGGSNPRPRAWLARQCGPDGKAFAVHGVIHPNMLECDHLLASVEIASDDQRSLMKLRVTESNGDACDEFGRRPREVGTDLRLHVSSARAVAALAADADVARKNGRSCTARARVRVRRIRIHRHRRHSSRLRGCSARAFEKARRRIWPCSVDGRHLLRESGPEAHAEDGCFNHGTTANPQGPGNPAATNRDHPVGKKTIGGM